MLRRVLDVIADVLTLCAITVAAIGHVAFGGNLAGMLTDPLINHWVFWVSNMADSNLAGSGIFLGLLAVLIVLSLVKNWPPIVMRIFNLGMFACAVATMLFQIMLMSAFSRARIPPEALTA